MKNLPKRVGRPATAKPPGGPYEHEGPAALPDAHESNSESVWALFHETPAPPAAVSDTESEFARRAALVDQAEAEAEAEAQAQNGADPAPHAVDTGFADTDFLPTGFTESVYDPTVPGALLPVKRAKP